MREARFWVVLLLLEHQLDFIFPLLYVATQGKRSVWNHLYVNVDTLFAAVWRSYIVWLWPSVPPPPAAAAAGPVPIGTAGFSLSSLTFHLTGQRMPTPRFPIFPFYCIDHVFVCILLYILSSDFVICRSTILGCLKWNCPAGFQLQEARWGCGMPGISPGSIGNSRHLPLGKGPDMNLLLRHATPLTLFPAFAAAQEFSTVYCPCQWGTEKKGTFKQKKSPEADICVVHVQLKKILERRHFNFIELTPSLTFLAWCSSSSVFMSAGGF